LALFTGTYRLINNNRVLGEKKKVLPFWGEFGGNPTPGKLGSWVSGGLFE